MGSLLYFPERELWETPAAAGLSFDDLDIQTDDGQRLHGWSVRAEARSWGQILLFHGNGGNISDRVAHARLLARAGFDVVLFDYRGYGRSTGKPSEEGTYVDARAALRTLLRTGVDPAGLIYLGESLGGAIALALALESPPRGLILQSAFTSVRDVARRHYPFIPTVAIPDAYPSLRRIPNLRVPLLVIHGDRDPIVPASHGRALFEAAPEPKRLEVFPGLGHNDLLLAGERYREVIVDWVRSALGGAARPGAAAPNRADDDDDQEDPQDCRGGCSQVGDGVDD
jgi:pimeloyl-ACP methyl ester carboxylesterase